MIDFAVTDFPEPDSPTTPKTSPAFTDNEIFSTAIILPSSVSNCTFKFLISSKDGIIIYSYEDQPHRGDHLQQKQKIKLTQLKKNTGIKYHW